MLGPLAAPHTTTAPAGKIDYWSIPAAGARKVHRADLSVAMECNRAGCIWAISCGCHAANDAGKPLASHQPVLCDRYCPSQQDARRSNAPTCPCRETEMCQHRHIRGRPDRLHHETLRQQLRPPPPLAADCAYPQAANRHTATGTRKTSPHANIRRQRGKDGEFFPQDPGEAD